MNFEHLRDMVERMKARKRRAASRFVHTETARAWFALLGVDLSATELAIGELAVLRRVEEPPGEIELASALVDKGLMSAVGRYASAIRVEMGVERLRSDNPQSA
jgi:hypothetical protein